MRTARAIVALVAAAGALAACSSDTKDPTAAAASGTVTVRMTDNVYSPATITAKAGQRVTFKFVNDGKLAHEAFIGDAKAQSDHAAEMGAMGDMGDHGSMHMGSDDGPVKVEPGKTGELTHTFDKAGTVLIGCHQPGHYESGMKATVDVN